MVLAVVAVLVYWLTYENSTYIIDIKSIFYPLVPISTRVCLPHYFYQAFHATDNHAPILKSIHFPCEPKCGTCKLSANLSTFGKDHFFVFFSMRGTDIQLDNLTHLNLCFMSRWRAKYIALYSSIAEIATDQGDEFIMCQWMSMPPSLKDLLVHCVLFLWLSLPPYFRINPFSEDIIHNIWWLRSSLGWPTEHIPTSNRRLLFATRCKKFTGRLHLVYPGNYTDVYPLPPADNTIRGSLHLLKFDLYPTTRIEKPCPLLLELSGAGWSQGECLL